MSALLFGSISTIADTSERQRVAFNEAFQEHGLDWTWDRDEYLTLLTQNGGADRIAEYARARGEEVDADAVHATKSQRFRDGLESSPPTPREGVVEAISAAQEGGRKLGLVTTTAKENVDALLASLSPTITPESFDLLVDVTSVEQSKPEPDAYLFALEQLGERPEDCVAIEDNPGGVQSANGAGVRCIAFPNQNTGGQDFGAADKQVDRLDPADLGGAAA